MQDDARPALSGSSYALAEFVLDLARLIEVLGPLEHLVARERRILLQTINEQDARSSPYLTPIGTILKGVKDHKQITLESR